MSQRPVVMIGSTFEDLAEYREQAVRACYQADFVPVPTEYLLPKPGTDLPFTHLQSVDDADIYVGIIGDRYGYVPAGQHSSII